MPLPNFLPCPGKELRAILSPNSDSLASVLGLALSYLSDMKAMQWAISSPSDENARASVHILQLFIQDPLVQSLLPKGPPPSHPAAEELSALHVRLVSLENTVVNLAGAQALQKAQPPAAKETSAQNAPSKPVSYASTAATPRQPSAVVEATAYLLSDKKPGDTNTTMKQLTSALPHFSEAALPEIAAEAPQSLPNNRYTTPQYDSELMTLQILNVPTGKSDTRGPYTPDELHDAFTAQDPAYARLPITHPPTWVQEDRTAFPPGSESTVIFTFEDMEKSNSWFILWKGRLRVFGRDVEVMRVPG